MRKEKNYYDIRLYAFPYTKKESAPEQYARIVVNATKYFDKFSKYDATDFSDLPRLLKQLLIVKDFSDTREVLKKLIQTNLVEAFKQMYKHVKTKKIIDSDYVNEQDFHEILKRLNPVYNNLLEVNEYEK